MREPDYIGIGFQRCATTWMRSCLGEHPAVGIKSTGIHYFSDHSDEDVQWYYRQLQPQSNRDVLVDLSVSYGYPENIAPLIEMVDTVAPQARIFASVREPIDRAYSDYRRSLFQGAIPGGMTFEGALVAFPEFLERGRYRTLLKPLVDAFGKDRLRVFFYEDVVLNPEQAWSDLCSYLEISDQYQPSHLAERVNHMARPRSRAILDILRGTSRLLSIAPLVRGPWRQLKTRPVWQRLAKLAMKDQSHELPLKSPAIVSFYEPDLKYLEDITGRCLDRWR